MHYATVGSVAVSHGWKLHVSSRAERYVELVSTLMEEQAVRAVPFKLAMDEKTVHLINDGQAGGTQIGKVITFYPESEASALALGQRLAHLLRGWPGPIIENELRLEPHAPVFARYGSFQRRLQRTRLGLQMDVLEAPNGELVRDLRGVALHEALGVECPFGGAAVASPPQVVGGRFVLVGLMVETNHSKVFHAVDMESCDECLVKLVRRHTSTDQSGRDAADRLRGEYELLTALQMPQLTQPRAFHAGDDWAALAMTRFAATDLFAWRRRGSRSAAQRSVAARIVAVLCELHERGVIVGDINPRNILVSDALDVYFVDLECAASASDPEEPMEFGAHGYLSPELASGACLSPHHDLYGLAAVLFFLVSGIELSVVPQSDALLMEMGPELPLKPWREVHQLLVGAAHGSTVEVLRQARELLLEDVTGNEVPSILRPTLELDTEQLTKHLERAAHSVIRLAAQDDNGHPIWVSRHPLTRDQHYSDLQLGDAGVALALLRVGLALSSIDLVEHAVEAASGLWQRLSNTASQSLPGLFVGDGGAALLFLSIHEVLGTADWLARSVIVSRQLATLPCPSPDLLHGCAGLGLVHLWTYERTGDALDLDAAIDKASTLGNTVRVDGSSVGWVIPDGYGDLSGQALYGMAHGVAGIVYFLNELLRVHPAAPVGKLLDRALLTLMQAQAHNPLIGAMDWPCGPSGEFRGGVWCHGSAGVAQALARVYRRTRNPAVLKAAEQAARAALLQAQWIGTSQCHGLAGLIEVLLDLYRATGDEQWVVSARQLGAYLLRYFTAETEFGPLTPSDRHDVFTAELMVGASGAIASLARLLDVDRWGSLLLPPREAFRPMRSV
jgi:serine/threonine protein kinase